MRRLSLADALFAVGNLNTRQGPTLVLLKGRPHENPVSTDRSARKCRDVRTQVLATQLVRRRVPSNDFATSLTQVAKLYDHVDCAPDRLVPRVTQSSMTTSSVPCLRASTLRPPCGSNPTRSRYLDNRLQLNHSCSSVST